MSLGMEAAGFDVAAAVEIDPIHAAAHHFNFPYTRTICKDITKLDTQELKWALGKVGVAEPDVVVGGPPCQGFSHIGKRQLDDPRNQLVFEYCRIIRGLMPKYFVFENVPGMNSGKHKLFVDELVREFEDMGYRVASPIAVKDAHEYGVAQRRRRLILLGSRNDCPPIVYPTAAQAMRQKPGARCAIGDLERHEVFVDADRGIPASALDYSGYRESFAFLAGGAFSLCHRRSFEHATVWGHLGSRHTEESVRRFEATLQGETEPISRFYKLHPDRPSHTLRAGTASNRGAFTAPRPIHYSAPRCISIREAARLQSFPDWFQFHRTIWHGFRQIGNSVAPLFAKAIGDVIIDAMGVDRETLPVRQLDPQYERLVTMNMSEAAAYYEVPSDTIAPRQRLAVNL